MMDVNSLRISIKEGGLEHEPFKVMAAISKVCSESVELGRDLVIRALDSKERLGWQYRDILEELVMQVGLYPYVNNLPELSRETVGITRACKGMLMSLEADKSVQAKQ